MRWWGGAAHAGSYKAGPGTATWCVAGRRAIDVCTRGCPGPPAAFTRALATQSAAGGALSAVSPRFAEQDVPSWSREDFTASGDPSTGALQPPRCRPDTHPAPSLVSPCWAAGILAWSEEDLASALLIPNAVIGLKSHIVPTGAVKSDKSLFPYVQYETTIGGWGCVFVWCVVCCSHTSTRSPSRINFTHNCTIRNLPRSWHVQRYRGAAGGAELGHQMHHRCQAPVEDLLHHAQRPQQRRAAHEGEGGAGWVGAGWRPHSWWARKAAPGSTFVSVATHVDCRLVPPSCWARCVAPAQPPALLSPSPRPLRPPLYSPPPPRPGSAPLPESLPRPSPLPCATGVRFLPDCPPGTAALPPCRSPSRTCAS